MPQDGTAVRLPRAVVGLLRRAAARQNIPVHVVLGAALHMWSRLPLKERAELIREWITAGGQP